MTNITDRFTDHVNGYDKAQVDSYIQKLSVEYMTLHRQYMELSMQQDELKKRSSADMETISAVMAAAEKEADKTIMLAQRKAALMMETATKELQKAQEEKSRITTEIYHMLTKWQIVTSAAVKNKQVSGEK